MKSQVSEGLRGFVCSGFLVCLFFILLEEEAGVVDTIVGCATSGSVCLALLEISKQCQTL